MLTRVTNMNGLPVDVLYLIFFWPLPYLSVRGPPWMVPENPPTSPSLGFFANMLWADLSHAGPLEGRSSSCMNTMSFPTESLAKRLYPRISWMFPDTTKEYRMSDASSSDLHSSISEALSLFTRTSLTPGRLRRRWMMAFTCAGLLKYWMMKDTSTAGQTLDVSRTTSSLGAAGPGEPPWDATETCSPFAIRAMPPLTSASSLPGSVSTKKELSISLSYPPMSPLLARRAARYWSKCKPDEWTIVSWEPEAALATPSSCWRPSWLSWPLST
mmetsp:Transcript_16984/g.47833  ORF Transcript_16984/g.47833 Transcript_16984/m.47833 type:complete len:271 (+) Transcript_16984:491-1303(+)